MMPQDLYRHINARRRALGLDWAQLAARLDVTVADLHAIRVGRISLDTRGRVEAWLTETAEAVNA
ncbi:hypothetical protein [Microbispora rosea]